VAFVDEMLAIIRESTEAGLEAMAEYLADEVRDEAPGAKLKENIGWFREALAVIVGPVKEPLAPWWRVAELGGWIRAKNWFPYVHSRRDFVGPLLWIPFQKMEEGEFIPTVKLLRRGAMSGVALEYTKGSKTLGPAIAALKQEVYHPPHKGTGYLNVVIEAQMQAAVDRFNAAMQAKIDELDKG